MNYVLYYGFGLLVCLYVICFTVFGIPQAQPILEPPVREIPMVGYNPVGDQCVLIYPDTMIYKECKGWKK
jgi:hypothetical protein